MTTSTISKRNLGILLTAFLFVLTGTTICMAEIPVTIDPKILKEFNAQVVNIHSSKEEVVRSSQHLKKVLQNNGKVFEKAEEGSKGQMKAANAMVDGMLDAIDTQLGPLEKYSKELDRMQEINAKAAKNAKPDKDAIRGNKAEITAYNKLVGSMEGWNNVFDQFNAPELERNSKEMKQILKAMRNEVLIAKANQNRFTDAMFTRIDQRLLDYRLRLNAYVRSLRGMVNGIVQARQAGQVNETLGMLENLLGDIDGKIIPEFL